MFHCRAQTIIRIALAIVAPPFGTVFLATEDKQSLGLFKRLIKEVRRGTAFVESSFMHVNTDIF